MIYHEHIVFNNHTILSTLLSIYEQTRNLNSPPKIECFKLVGDEIAIFHTCLQSPLSKNAVSQHGLTKYFTLFSISLVMYEPSDFKALHFNIV
jgi:hypothetical protein